MKKCLIIVDAQNDFITGSLANEEAQKAVPNIVNKIKERKWDYIFVTRDTHDSDYLSTNEGKLLPVEHCIYGTDGWEIEHSISEALVKTNPTHGKGYINKPTFGSLVAGSHDSVSLITFLKKIKIDIVNDESIDIEICGFCTDICVVSNALIVKAELYDKANITVDASCCAGVTPEKHKAALEVMKSCQINVINE